MINKTINHAQQQGRDDASEVPAGQAGATYRYGIVDPVDSHKTEGICTRCQLALFPVARGGRGGGAGGGIPGRAQGSEATEGGRRRPKRMRDIGASAPANQLASAPRRE